MTRKITLDPSGENVTPPEGMDPISKRTTSTDISLRYLEWEGDGSPVILLHGLTVCAEYWSPTAQLLAQEHDANWSAVRLS